VRPTAQIPDQPVADAGIQTIAEATAHTVLIVDGCSLVSCDWLAVTDRCTPISVLVAKPQRPHKVYGSKDRDCSLVSLTESFTGQ
jgi:hypothetical protein